MPQDDKRRVRAVAHAVLTDAAGEGHTFLPVATLLTSVRARFPERRECRPDEEVFLGQDDFHGQVLQFDEIDEVPVVALRALREREQRVADLLKRMTRKSYPDAPAIDWKAQLRTVFDPPKSEREHTALAEKEIALEVLYRQRVSVLMGGAGVGKTKALQVFVNSLVAAEGMQPMLLLAPTGKARVRLAESTKRRAQTIHQVLRKQELIGPRLTLKVSTSVPPQRVSTIIVDEASMPSVDLLACLLRAVNTDAIRRLIFVGDPNQLPPIGPGRPFGELIEWLRSTAPQCIGELFTCMRTVEVDGGETVSPGLELASTYRDDAHPGDDAILARLARRENLGDVEIDFWNSPADLHRLIRTKLKRHAAKVRSKSEVIVAYALEKMGLRPLYEVPLYAKSGDPTDFKLPDFTIMFEGETWYWEHLGMLSKPKYLADWQDKKAWYIANGYWERVVTSEDGVDGSIQADMIEAIARVRILESV
jgi:hypothetical protein